MKILAPLAMALLSVASCHNKGPVSKSNAATDSTSAYKDYHTQSNADSVQMNHLSLDIAVSFEKKQISGRADWSIENKTGAPELHLDDYGLHIDSVAVDGKKTSFSLDAPVPILGNRLRIPITTQSKLVSIWYATSDSARALQWLTPEQTASKKQPFLYTQDECINARSWVPCADGPGIRFTYDARVRVPQGLIALMSAENPQAPNDSGVYHFKMENPVPAYLLALAVGDISFRPIDPRSGVYAEPSIIDKARYEFADVGKMISTAESLYGPYRWGRYDVLVAPPGFPMGGMENPRLTFCTPTVIAGDRSLVNLIAHELAHSWSGNLVTNATWDDIWMNEGFTVYIERRITEALTDKSYVDMLWELGYQDLEDEVARLGKTSPDTWLKLNMKGRNPDDCLSDIPYEKGAAFLWLIERNVGRERFDAFLKKYFSEHAFHSITTEAFLKYLRANLILGDTALEKKLDIHAWVYEPGIPANCPRADSARFRMVNLERSRFLNGSPAAQLQTGSWTTYEWLHFLRNMPENISLGQMKALDGQFHFTQSGNSEIADLWYAMSVQHRYTEAYPAMEKFLSHVGRQKFLEPVYGALMETGQQEVAKRLYDQYRQNYHPLTQAILDKMIRK
ncbi:MAG: M1 family metallopeptidase [Bacteroidetes bacterium]|nr:M1 family metallopeptidase [Bacteroidota bacterium]MBS1628812.1 M1 family metallopeptidase [Bacteroidota bacterium]